MQNKLIIANWKMNTPNLKSWRGFRAPKGVEVVVCPPFPYLERVKSQEPRATLGAQDCFWEEKGAYTGEVSAAMLKNFGVEYVIIGHSERRRWLHETDEMINRKVLAALRAGLKVILCVGEPLAVRRKGLAAAKKSVANQLRQDLRDVRNWKLEIGNLAIAYEPLWAISGGDKNHPADKPEDALEMIRFIKEFLRIKCQMSNVKCLYGGSVNSKNAASFIQLNDIDGALVGVASLDAKEFTEIIKIANKNGSR